MDPRTNVVEQQALALGILKHSDNPHADAAIAADAVRLAELCVALIEWRESGGFDPFTPDDAPKVNPQANALLRICRNNSASNVIAPRDGGSPGMGLPDGYITVFETHGSFTCGIDTDGRVSS